MENVGIAFHESSPVRNAAKLAICIMSAPGAAKRKLNPSERSVLVVAQMSHRPFKSGQNVIEGFTSSAPVLNVDDGG